MAGKPWSCAHFLLVLGHQRKLSMSVKKAPRLYFG